MKKGVNMVIKKEEEGCSECDEGNNLDRIVLPDYGKGQLKQKLYCDWCGYKEKNIVRCLNTEDKKRCKVCNSLYMPEEQKKLICNYCRKHKVIKYLLVQKFGVLIPEKTGFVFGHQTNGVMCHNVYLEGVFFPLKRPKKFYTEDESLPERYSYLDDEWGNVDLLSALKYHNYMYNSEMVEKVWSDIKDEMRFEFEEVSRPSEDHPKTCEGLKWIKIKEEQEEYFDFRFGDNVIGKTVGLLYPNSD